MLTPMFRSRHIKFVSETDSPFGILDASGNTLLVPEATICFFILIMSKEVEVVVLRALLYWWRG